MKDCLHVGAYSVIIIMLNIFSTKLSPYTSLRNQAAGQN